MLLALKTTNTLAATSSKFHCSIHHALGSQKNNTNLLDVAARQKRIKLSRARLIPTPQFCQVWPDNTHEMQVSTPLPEQHWPPQLCEELFFLNGFSFSLHQHHVLKLWFGYTEPLHSLRRDGFGRQPSSGWPQLSWGSAELTMCSSGVKPAPTGNSHRELSAAGAGPVRLQCTWAKPAWSMPVLTVTALLALNPNSQSWHRSG